MPCTRHLGRSRKKAKEGSADGIPVLQLYPTALNARAVFSFISGLSVRHNEGEPLSRSYSSKNYGRDSQIEWRNYEVAIGVSCVGCR